MKTLKKLISILLVLALTLALAACGAGKTPANAADSSTAANAAAVEPPAETHNLRFNVLLSEGTNQATYAYKWADLVKERSNGAIDITVYTAGQLGTGMEQVEAVQNGAIDIGWADSSTLANLSGTLELLSQPFLISDFNQLAEIYDGEIGESVKDALVEENLRWLSVWWIGPRQMFTQVKLESFDDMKGIKVRVPELDMYINMYKTLGMNPTPISYSELFSSLQSGIVDAACCNFEDYYVLQYYTVCPYVWHSNHIWQVGGPMINEDVYQSLPAELQDILTETAQEIAVEQRAAYEESEATRIAELEAKGVTVSDLNTFTQLDELYTRFREGMWKDTAERLNMTAEMENILAAVGK